MHYERLVSGNIDKPLPAAALVRIMHSRYNGETAVVRRFTKSSKRLRDGLFGILRASDEEPNSNEVITDTNNTGILLTLLLNHANVFYEALPSHLDSNSALGSAGIRFLLNSTQTTKVLSSADVTAFVAFAQRAILREPHGTPQWYHALSLLEYLLRYYGNLTMQAFQHNHQFEFEGVFGIIGQVLIDAGQPYLRDTCTLRARGCILQFIRTCSAISTRFPSPVETMLQNELASTATLIVTNQVHGPVPSCPMRSGHEECHNLADVTDGALLRRREQTPFMRALALAALVPLLEFEEMRQDVRDLVDQLLAVCYDVMLGHTEWQFEIEEAVVRNDS